MTDNDPTLPHEIGRRAEDRAERHLLSQGLQTVARNYRFARGELDLVMLDGDVLAFVEVRYRGSDGHGSGAESVYIVKRRRIIATAQHFLQTHPAHVDRVCRFDVVVVGSGPQASSGGDNIEWIRDAFQA